MAWERWEPSWPGLESLSHGRGACGSRWQHAGKRVRPHGNGTSCEEMGWEAPGSGGNSAVPDGPAAVSVWGHWDPLGAGDSEGCWRCGVTPQRRVWGTPQMQGKRSMSPLGLCQPMAVAGGDKGRTCSCGAGLEDNRELSSAPRPGFGGLCGRCPALDGGGGHPRDPNPRFQVWDCRGDCGSPWETVRTAGIFTPSPSWL